MTSLSFAARARPLPSAFSRCTMHEKRVHRLAVHPACRGLHHVRVPVAGVIVIHGPIAAGEALDSVMEINENFIQRQQAGQHDAARIQRLSVVPPHHAFR